MLRHSIFLVIKIAEAIDWLRKHYSVDVYHWKPPPPFFFSLNTLKIKQNHRKKSLFQIQNETLNQNLSNTLSGTCFPQLPLSRHILKSYLELFQRQHNSSKSVITRATPVLPRLSGIPNPVYIFLWFRSEDHGFQLWLDNETRQDMIIWILNQISGEAACLKS